MQIAWQNIEKLRYHAGIEFQKNNSRPLETETFNPYEQSTFENRPFNTNYNNNNYNFSRRFNDQNYHNVNAFRKNGDMNSNRDGFVRNANTPRYFEPSRFNSYNQNYKGENYILLRKIDSDHVLMKM